MSLAVEQLSCGYGGPLVLRDVSLTVGASETVALLGANGAGKSTLLRCIAGVLGATSGDVVLSGESVVRCKPWTRCRRGLALVPEGRHVFGALTVRENLVAGSMTKRNRFSLADAYELFPRLGERAAQLAGTLSGGEQQMLAIARALMSSPDVLAIDEMSAGLAPIIVQQLVDALARLRSVGTAVLLVEQSPHSIADLADKVYLLSAGRVVGVGTMAELGGPDEIARMYLGVDR